MSWTAIYIGNRYIGAAGSNRDAVIPNTNSRRSNGNVCRVTNVDSIGVRAVSRCHNADVVHSDVTGLVDAHVEALAIEQVDVVDRCVRDVAQSQRLHKMKHEEFVEASIGG